MSGFWDNGDHWHTYVHFAGTVCSIWMGFTLQHLQEGGESKTGGKVDGKDEKKHRNGEGGNEIGACGVR